MADLNAVRAALVGKSPDTPIIVAIELETAVVGGVAVAARQEYRLLARDLFPDAPATPPAAQPDPATQHTMIAGESLNIRAQPDASSARLGSVQAGASVQALDQTANGYRQIVLTGWVLEQHLQQS